MAHQTATQRAGPHAHRIPYSSNPLRILCAARNSPHRVAGRLYALPLFVLRSGVDTCPSRIGVDGVNGRAPIRHGIWMTCGPDSPAGPTVGWREALGRSGQAELHRFLRYHLGASTAASQGQVVMNSKYLRAAQELLDEVVSVSKGVDDVDTKAKSAASVKKKEDSEGLSGGGGEEGASGAKGGAPAPEMSTAERQELQMKKGKLVNMLDEVEQRYRQYHQQMASVSSSFEAVAGAGSARTYTALALRTISRQFRCLRDAIASQDCDAEGLGGGRGVGSRLRYIDHQLRQQRALQQLGMMQSSAWRPQRGLPERSVSILRAWLFEHFLHPYPKDSDKIMLAKQTGLTRSQEMYLEETKEHQQQQDGGDDKGRPGGSGAAGYDMNMQTTKSFAAQLMRDFVA
ncbi:BEL1-like homeodomain protein 1 [Triticum urartu]|uniref:BEL1-like homeodomain protein 1 n=1 Tax=Triticum urartu TaxID=4572 RepID=M8AC22_TRIUA|nr:BEL1-like homeodomain protein 1 [Triticum urartu]